MYPIINDPQNYNGALYLRLSKEDAKREEENDEADSESIVNQKELLEQYARDQGLGTCGLYIEA